MTAIFKKGTFTANFVANSSKSADGNPDHAVVTLMYNGVMLRDILPLKFNAAPKGGILSLTKSWK